jgi:hypothetical protein
MWAHYDGQNLRINVSFNIHDFRSSMFRNFSPPHAGEGQHRITKWPAKSRGECKEGRFD